MSDGERRVSGLGRDATGAPHRQRPTGRPRWTQPTAALCGVAVITAAWLAACGGGGPDLAQGRRVYGQHCASCHGADGGGGRVGTRRVPSLQGVSRLFRDPDDQARFVANGGGGMPRFVEVLSEEEIDAVVAYTRRRFG